VSLVIDWHSADGLTALDITVAAEPLLNDFLAEDTLDDGWARVFPFSHFLILPFG
jgi:hypothetical protein